MSLTEDFVFSQSSLQDYLDCPQRFEYRYLLELEWPALETESVLDHEANMLKGQEFHHLLHQHALGVPPEAIEKTIEDIEKTIKDKDKSLHKWWRSYLRWQEANLPAQRYPELTLTTPLAGYLLTAKYDVVARIPDDDFVIIDWKTGRRQDRSRLAKRMQTIVYPYVLWRAGAWLNQGEPIPPDRIRMIYWFAEGEPAIEFRANQDQLRDYEERLTGMINQIVAQSEYTQTDEKKICRFCTFRSLCDRGVKAGQLHEIEEDPDSAGAPFLDLDEIEEISF